MSEGQPTGIGPEDTDLSALLNRLQKASENGRETTPIDSKDQEYFCINQERYPQLAEAAPRVIELLQPLESQQRMIEQTAVAAAMLWPNNHGDQYVHYLDSSLQEYKERFEDAIYRQDQQEIGSALQEERRRYLGTFWNMSKDSLIIPSAKGAGMEFLLPLIADNVDDPAKFHSTLLQTILPLYASLYKKTPSSETAQSYLAMRKAVEAAGVGWIIDPFVAEGRTRTQLQEQIGWDNRQIDLISAVDPFDGYAEDVVIPDYPYVGFAPRIIGGNNGGMAVTELGQRVRLSQF